MSPEVEFVSVAAYFTDITQLDDRSYHCGVEQSCTKDCRVHFTDQAGHDLKGTFLSEYCGNTFSKLQVSNKICSSVTNKTLL